MGLQTSTTAQLLYSALIWAIWTHLFNKQCDLQVFNLHLTSYLPPYIVHDILIATQLNIQPRMQRRRKALAWEHRKQLLSLLRAEIIRLLRSHPWLPSLTVFLEETWDSLQSLLVNGMLSLHPAWVLTPAPSLPIVSQFTEQQERTFRSVNWMEGADKN